MSATAVSSPLSSNGIAPPSSMNKYTRAEVAAHKKPEDLWIIIHGRVYNVTDWARKHPGGTRIIRHYGGEDASVSVG